MAPVPCRREAGVWRSREPVAYETMEGSPVWRIVQVREAENENATTPLARRLAPFRKQEERFDLYATTPPIAERQHPGRASASAWTFAAQGSGVPWRGRIAAFYRKARARRRGPGSLVRKGCERRSVLYRPGPPGGGLSLGWSHPWDCHPWIAALGIAAMRMVAGLPWPWPPWPWGGCPAPPWAAAGAAAVAAVLPGDDWAARLSCRGGCF